MVEKLEALIKKVYKGWRKSQPRDDAHPALEDLACFLENKLSAPESERIKSHLLACDACAESLAMQIRLQGARMQDIPPALLEWSKNLVSQEEKSAILEILLGLKENLLELINTTGDVLVGQELVPAPVLRSRKIKDFKDEVTVLKDFQDVRVEAKIENKQGKAFSLAVTVKDKPTQKLMKDLRITLIQGDVELESYHTESGRVIFEHVLLGKYNIEILSLGRKLAAIMLDIKI